MCEEESNKGQLCVGGEEGGVGLHGCLQVEIAQGVAQLARADAAVVVLIMTIERRLCLHSLKRVGYQDTIGRVRALPLHLHQDWWMLALR